MSHSKDVDARQDMTEIIKRRMEIKQKLVNLEKQIYDFETTYLEESVEHGNVMRGFNKLFESAVSGMANAATLTSTLNNPKTRRHQKRHFDETDRLFSLSSVTSPVSQSMNDGKEAERSLNSQNGLQKSIKGSFTNGERTTNNKSGRYHQREENCQSPASLEDKGEFPDDEHRSLQQTSGPTHKRSRRAIIEE